jgi:hypothetical protein
MHRLNCERTAFHFLDCGLLVGDRLNEELAAHRRRMPHVIERGHGIVECHVPGDRIRLDVDFQLAVWPRHFPAHDGRVVGAFLRTDGEVNAVGEIVAVVEGRVVVIVDVLGQNVLAFLDAARDSLTW